MKLKLLSGLALLALSAGVASAQNLRPLPNPDLSRLSAAESAELREARANFDKAVVGKSGVTLAELYGNLAAVYARARLLDVTRVAIDNAALAAPLDDRWPYLQGTLARMDGQHAQARAAFEKSLRLNGMYLPTRIALAGELLRADDVAGADRLLAAALADHERQPALRAMLADVAYRQQRYKDAIAYLQEALRLDPRATALYGALARAHEAAGQPKEAAEARARTGDVPPYLEDPLSARLLPAPVMSNLAAAARQAGAARAAQPAAPAGAQQAPDPRAVAIGEANQFAAAGRYADARAALDKALASSPRDVSVLSTYARVEAADRRFDAARARATEATRAEPTSVLAWMTFGFVAEVSGDDVGAGNAYQRAVSADPKATAGQIALGNLALRSGRAADAVSAYRATTLAEPENAENWARLLAAQFSAGQCAAGLREAAENARQHPRDPLFADLYIRAASTCPAATPAQKKAVLGNAEALYRQAPATSLAQIAETYALALAANGRWDEAIQTQGSAIYETATLGDQGAAAQYREVFQQLQAKRMPNLPWAGSHPLLKPQRPAPPPKAATGAPAGKK